MNNRITMDGFVKLLIVLVCCLLFLESKPVKRSCGGFNPFCRCTQYINGCYECATSCSSRLNSTNSFQIDNGPPVTNTSDFLNFNPGEWPSVAGNISTSGSVGTTSNPGSSGTSTSTISGGGSTGGGGGYLVCPVLTNCPPSMVAYDANNCPYCSETGDHTRPLYNMNNGCPPVTMGPNLMTDCHIDRKGCLECSVSVVTTTTPTASPTTTQTTQINKLSTTTQSTTPTTTLSTTPTTTPTTTPSTTTTPTTTHSTTPTTTPTTTPSTTTTPTTTHSTTPTTTPTTTPSTTTTPTTTLSTTPTTTQTTTPSTTTTPTTTLSNTPTTMPTTTPIATPTRATTMTVTTGSQYCLQCDEAVSPHTCSHVTNCGNKENCFINTFVNYMGGIRYRLGCRDTHQCRNAVRRELTFTTGNRNTPSGQVMRSTSIVSSDENLDDPTTSIVCSQCCNGSLCNSGGCGATPYPDLRLGTRGPLCFSCSQQSATDDCDTLRLCSRNQICKLEQFTISDIVLWRTSCEDTRACQTLMNNAGSTCTSTCCSSDLCNHECPVRCPTLHCHLDCGTPPRYKKDNNGCDVCVCDPASGTHVLIG